MEKIKKYSTGFTQVSNQVITDPNLSLKAKAMYAYLFSKPDGWVFHIITMKNEIKESRCTIYTAIKELIERGYIKRNQANNGCFGCIEYEFIDTLPCTKNPHTVKPHTEKQHTNNTYKTKKEDSNISPKPPEGCSVDISSILFDLNQDGGCDMKSWDRLIRWINRNNVDICELKRIVHYWSQYQDRYSPRMYSVNDLILKYGRLVRWYNNIDDSLK